MHAEERLDVLPRGDLESLDQGESQSFTLGVVVARDHEIVYLGGHEDEAARVQFVVQALVLRRLRIAEL